MDAILIKGTKVFLLDWLNQGSLSYLSVSRDGEVNGKTAVNEYYDEKSNEDARTFNGY